MLNFWFKLKNTKVSICKKCFFMCLDKFYFYATDVYNLKINGKVFRWFFFTYKIRYRLNHAHITNLYLNFPLLKLRLGKYHNYLLTWKPIRKNRFFCLFSLPRKQNIFTGRGTENFTFRQYSKLGKISSYYNMLNWLWILFTFIAVIVFLLYKDKMSFNVFIFYVHIIGLLMLNSLPFLFACLDLHTLILLLVYFLLISSIELVIYLFTYTW